MLHFLLLVTRILYLNVFNTEFFQKSNRSQDFYTRGKPHLDARNKRPTEPLSSNRLFDYNFLCFTFAYLSYIMKQEIDIQERSVHIHTHARAYMNS